MKLEKLSKSKKDKRETREKDLKDSLAKLEKARSEHREKKKKEQESLFGKLKKSKSDEKKRRQKEADKAKELPKKEVITADPKAEAQERIDAHKERLKGLSKDSLLLLCEKYKISLEGDKKADFVEAIFNHEIKL